MDGIDAASIQKWVSDQLANGNHGLWLSWAVFGLIAGIVAKIILPGRDPGGIIVTMALGIAGAFVGNYIYGYCTGDVESVTSQFSLFGLFLAVLGGFCLLVVYRVLFGGFRVLR